MTSCDLSDQTKGWKTTRKIAVGTGPPNPRKHRLYPLPSSMCPPQQPEHLSVLNLAWLYFGESEIQTTSGPPME